MKRSPINPVGTDAEEHPDCGFSREERIKHASDFKNLFREGKKAGAFGAKLFYRPNNRQINRIGFALPRGYGNAVARNHSRRLSREVYRLLKNELRRGYDMLLLVYPGGDSFEQRSGQLRFLCKKAGLISS